MKKILTIVLVIALLVPLCFIGNVDATEVIGRITSDITWTKSQSPVTLTGPVNVNTGVTLTIEPGVTVNLNNYYIQVEGTLQSIGTSSDQIGFDNGKIAFKETSKGWNEQKGSGNIFQYNTLNNVTVEGYNPLSSSSPAIKFDQNTLNGDINVGSASIITRNTVVGSIGASGSTIVWKNVVTGSIGGGGSDTTAERFPIISCNILTQGAGYVNRGISGSGYTRIEDNTVSNCNYGINVLTGHDVMGYIDSPHVLIERNKVSNCVQGIHVEIYTATAYTGGYASVKCNTLSNCNIGVYADGELYGLTFKGNNIEGSTEYRFRLEGTDVNATQNWWGTTDTDAIRQSIYDGNRDFNLGTVTFEPILTSENAEAFPNQNAPMPTPQTSVSPTPNQTFQPTVQPTDNPSATPSLTATTTPTQQSAETPIFGSFNLEWAIFGALLIVIALLAVLIALVVKGKTKRAT